MSSKREQKVTLKHKGRGSKHTFMFRHALILLRKSSGWVIDDKKWIFQDNEICKKPSSKASKETDETSGDK